jgi:SAM-dependent methyltransferase
MFEEGGPSFAELMRQAFSSTERGYDLLAPKFDRTPFRTPDAIVEAVARRIDPPVEAVVDLCCGTGAALPFLRPRCRRLVGVDFSRGMLDVAQARGIDGLELVHADVLELDMENAFDAATCFGAFGHILPKDEPRFAAVIHRLLRPGGRFVFATAERPSRWSPGYLIAKGFNAAMHVRNALLSPPFVMFYLTFVLPDCAELLERQGFDVDVAASDARDFAPPYNALRIVTAKKR